MLSAELPLSSILGALLEWRLHDSAEKRQFFSSERGVRREHWSWEQRTTRGSSHISLGVVGYSSVAVRNELHYFGDECSHSRLTDQTVFTHWAPHPAMEDVGPLNNRGFVGHQCRSVNGVSGALHLWSQPWWGQRCGRPPCMWWEGVVMLSHHHHNVEHSINSINSITSGGVRTNEQHIFSLSTSEWYCVVSV